MAAQKMITLMTIDNPLLREVLSLIQMMEDSCMEFYEKLSSGAKEDCQILYHDLAAGTAGLLQCHEKLKDSLNRAYYLEMAENVEYTLSAIAGQINSGQDREALAQIQYQLFPFLQELWEEVYFWGAVYPDKKAMEHYYKKEFLPHHANSFLKKETPKYKLSLFIPVFNKLDYTRQCVDSIFKNTDLSSYPYELILLNDGSSDGTQEYFESLRAQVLAADVSVTEVTPDADAAAARNADSVRNTAAVPRAVKLLELKKNVKTMIFSLAYRVCEGEYFLFVNNDTLVTKGWLDNLMACMESDPDIISATPCTPNTSNYQGDLDGRFPFSSLSEVLGHENKSDPSLWEERARIMPVIALYRTKLVNRIGFADRLFYTMEFWDDDFSLRARRAGFRQMLCRDTYCHHFGSVTGKDAQVKENTLENGRRLFLLKNNLDAWGNDFCYDFQAMTFIKSSPLPEGPDPGSPSRPTADSTADSPEKAKLGQAAILGIDCGFGDTLLQMRSYLRANGKKAAVYTVSLEDTYAADLKAISDQALFAENRFDAVLPLVENSFDYIYLHEPLESYPDYDRLLPLLHSKLKNGGLLLFAAANLYYKPFLESFLNLSFPAGCSRLTFLNISYLQSLLQGMFSNTDCIAQTEAVAGAEVLKFCCRK